MTMKGDGGDLNAANKAAETGEGEPILVFRVATSWLGVSADAVDSVWHAPKPTMVPLAPAHIPGVVALGENVVPLLDLQRFLGIAAGEVRPTANGGADDDRGWTRIVLVSSSEMRVGLPCHQVGSVRNHRPQRAGGDVVVQGDRLRSFARSEEVDSDRLVVVLNLPALLEAARVQ